MAFRMVMADVMCPPGSLFLSLMADAGIYEYEPSSPDGDSSGT